MASQLIVEVYTNGKLTKSIDYSVKENRIWLGKHCFWALSQGFEILTKPVKA